MTKPIVIIHNVTTNEIIEREMTAAEFTAYKAQQDADIALQAEAEAKAAQRAALLSRLGITEEEARILLGGN